jgi:mannitol/fructose-specific phosphotransferase system IIA component (Ntr-type)
MKNLLTSESVVQLNVTATSWEDSIRKAGELLEKGQFISQDYIENMVDIVKKYGPYIVVFENVALAHAKAGEGVYKTGASLITLKSPVVYGNEDNDPVSIVIALASVNHSEHLDFLKSIMIAFSNGAKEQILNAQSELEVIEILNSCSKEEFEDEEI